MRHSKFGLRAFGLAIVAALGLMAFTAVAAQAENLGGGGVAGKFRVEGSTALSVSRTFTGAQEGSHGLLLVEGRNLTILCSTGKLLEGKVLTESEALVKVLFEGCTTWEFNLSKTIPCVVAEKEEEPAGSEKFVGKEMITATALILPKLHEVSAGVSELYLLFEGDPATAAFTKFILGGKECPLPKNTEVKGSVVALVTEGSTEQVQKLLTFSDPIQLLFQKRDAGTNKFLEGDRLLYGTFESFIDGSATAELTGSHVGKLWSVI